MLNGYNLSQESRGFFRERLSRRQFLGGTILLALINTAWISALFMGLYLFVPDVPDLIRPYLLILALGLTLTLLAPIAANISVLVSLAILGSGGVFVFDWFGALAFMVFILNILSLSLALTYFTRRFRDGGDSPRKIGVLTVASCLIPILYYISALILALSRGSDGPNRYGSPNSKPVRNALLPVGAKIWLPLAVVLVGMLITPALLWGTSEVGVPEDVQYVTYEDGGVAPLSTGSIEYTDSGCVWGAGDGYSLYGTEGFGIRITVPSYYKPCANNTSGGAWAFRSGLFGATEVFVVEHLGTLLEYFDDRWSVIQSSWGVAEVHQERRTTFAGLSAYLFDYTDDDGYRTLEIMAVRTKVGGGIYHFVSSDFSSFFDLPEIQNVADSVEIIEP